MDVVVPRIATKAELAAFLKSLPGFPPYVQPNWDSIEECLKDFVEQHGGDVKINNAFAASELNDGMSVYLDILRSIEGEFKNVRVTFGT